MPTALLSQLYPAHLATLQHRASVALERGGFDHLVIAAGQPRYQFLDDMPYPFQVNPHFKHWLPLLAHPHSWLAITPGQRPVLAYYQPDDYWHLPPSAPSGDWVEHFDVRVIRNPEDAAPHLPPAARSAILGEADAALPGYVPNNPDAVIAYLHWHRACKTPYELDKLRAASRRAVKGHRAAEDLLGDALHADRTGVLAPDPRGREERVDQGQGDAGRPGG